MNKVIVILLMVSFGLLAMHDEAEARHAKYEAAARAGVEHRLERLQTDVSDLKQTVDALGVACMARR